MTACSKPNYNFSFRSNEIKVGVPRTNEHVSIMGKSGGIWIRSRSLADIVAAKPFVCMSSASVLQVDISEASEQATSDWQLFLESLLQEIKKFTGKGQLQINSKQINIEALLLPFAKKHHGLAKRGLKLVDITNVGEVPRGFISFLKERQTIRSKTENWQLSLSDNGHHLYQQLTPQDSGLSIKIR